MKIFKNILLSVILTALVSCSSPNNIEELAEYKLGNVAYITKLDKDGHDYFVYSPVNGEIVVNNLTDEITFRDSTTGLYLIVKPSYSIILK